VFDVNTAIVTNAWINTIDNTPPTSLVTSLPQATATPDFRVTWQGTDEGAGVKDVTIYVSEDGGAFEAWLSNTSAGEGVFSGAPGRSYAFYSVARDLTNNVERKSPVVEATTAVAACAPDVTAALSIQRSAFRLNRTTRRYVQTVVITNVGSGDVVGPVSFVLDGLSATARLVGQSAVTACGVPLGSRYLSVSTGHDALLKIGEKATVLLEFANPTNRAIGYSPRVLAGSGAR
jgi:hypothetical protein